MNLVFIIDGGEEIEHLPDDQSEVPLSILNKGITYQLMALLREPLARFSLEPFFDVQ